jgi:hypothetical protein
LHGAFYIASERELCRQVEPGATIQVPLYASFMTDEDVGPRLTLEAQLHGWDTLGVHRVHGRKSQAIEYHPWMSQELPPLEIAMPRQAGLAVLSLTLRDAAGSVLHRNFSTYLVSGAATPQDETLVTDTGRLRVVRFAPASFAKAQWSLKQWNVLDGLKVNGAGAGFFEYTVPWPEGMTPEQVAQASLRLELSAKQLFGKDREGAATQEGDFMRGKGTHDPSSNPNSYPMTDDTRFPSAVRVRVMGQAAGLFDLADDSADHRGVLSWHSQLRDRRLREAGSYGYLVDAKIPQTALNAAHDRGHFVIRLEVDDALPGGLAIYGERFGRYPLDPTLVFVLQD